MKKAGYVCFPCWKEDGRDRPYSRSYDLIAHMVIVHGKYTDNAINNTAYRTDGSDVRDATAEEKLRYLDANKHKRKKATSAVSSVEPSTSETTGDDGAPAKSHPVSSRGEQNVRDPSSGDCGRSDSRSEKGRGRTDKHDERGSPGKSSDRGSARKTGSHNFDRRTKVTEVDEGIDNEEADQRMMIEIRDRIEARKIARDLKIARATIEQIKASKNKKDTDKKAGARRGSKKFIASQSATGVIPTEPVVSVGAVTRKSTPEPTVTKGTAVMVVPVRGRGSNQPATEVREDGALSTLKFSSIVGDGLRVAEPTGDRKETALGIAFVATALERRVPRVTQTHDVVGLADCYVELPSLRRKAQKPVSVAPRNSIDSDEAGRGDTAGELRLSHSDIHIGFPGDVCGPIENVEFECQPADVTVGRPSDEISVYAGEGAPDPEKAAEARPVAVIAESDGVAVLGIATSGVAASAEMTDAAATTGAIATPVCELSDTPVVKPPSVLPEAINTPSPVAPFPGSAEEKKALKAKYDLKQKMLREITASQLLREELAKVNPNLMNVSSFMSQVCGIDRGTRQLKETVESAIQKEREEELAAEPSVMIVTTFDDGGTVPASGLAEGNIEETARFPTVTETSLQTSVMPPETREKDARGVAISTEDRDDGLKSGDGIESGGGVVAQRTAESDAVSLVGFVMSIDGSPSEDSPDNSSCGSSVSASESRKRAAETSPERERVENSRRDFPGRVTRSAAGCRVYIPLMTDEGDNCPGRVLNIEGTFTERITLGQVEEVVSEIEEVSLLTIVEATDLSAALGPKKGEAARVVPTPTGSHIMPMGSPCRLFIEPIAIPRIGSVPVA